MPRRSHKCSCPEHQQPKPLTREEIHEIFFKSPPFLWDLDPRIEAMRKAGQQLLREGKIEP